MATTVRPSGLRIIAAEVALIADSEERSDNDVAPGAIGRTLPGVLQLVDEVTIDSSAEHVVELGLDPPTNGQPLVLVEQAAGFTWAKSRARDGELIFDLQLAAGPAHVSVFNRSASPVPMYHGPVQIWSADLDSWTNLGASDPIGLSDRQAQRILLLLHGVAGTTVSDFGLLAVPPWGQELMDSAANEYDAVVGFDHDTRLAPEQTAEQLRHLLAAWSNKHGTTIDVIALGRGAAVAAELTAPSTDQVQAGYSFATMIVVEEAGSEADPPTARELDALDQRTTSLFGGGRTVARETSPDGPAMTMLAKGFDAIARSVGVEATDWSVTHAGDRQVEIAWHTISPSRNRHDPVLLDRTTAYTIADWLTLDVVRDVPRMAGPDTTAGAEDGKRVMRGDEDAADSEAPDEPGRVVQAAVMRDGVRCQTFVAGQENILRCWIGPKEKDVQVGASDTPVPEFGVQVDLIVELIIDGEVVDRQTLSVPASPTSRSADCDFTIDLGASEFYLSAELAFTLDGRMYEYVQLGGRVLNGDETENDGELLKLKSRVKRRDVIALTDRTTTTSSIIVDDDGDTPFLRTFGSHGTGAFELDGKDALVNFLGNNLSVTSSRLIRHREKAAKEDKTTYVPFTDVEDEEWTELLRTSAKHGWLLHRHLLLQGFTDPGDRIEVINLQPDEYLPIEFIYDRGAPADDAKVLAECITAMAAGKADCGHCHPFAQLTEDERDLNPVICPYGFWSLRKVIERHSVDRDGTISSQAPSNEANTIDELGSVLCGWSAKIRDNDVEALKSAMSETGHVDFASDWKDWKAKLKANPGLLVALPHHAKGDDKLGSLEIGGDELGLERELRLYVRTQSQGPGPILILLGCETDDSDSIGHPSFARAFNGMGAPVVVGTLSKVIGRHAAPFATKLVSELIAGHNNGIDIGQVMLDVRRKMFADGYLMALGVIALGDGDWKVRTRQDAA